MAQKWNVKVRDLSNNSVEHVADFISSESAYDYKAKLINGSGGLFGRRYEAWVEEEVIEKKKVKHVRKY